jgi:hypothetical protein
MFPLFLPCLNPALSPREMETPIKERNISLKKSKNFRRRQGKNIKRKEILRAGGKLFRPQTMEKIRQRAQVAQLPMIFNRAVLKAFC